MRIDIKFAAKSMHKLLCLDVVVVIDRLTLSLDFRFDDLPAFNVVALRRFRRSTSLETDRVIFDRGSLSLDFVFLEAVNEAEGVRDRGHFPFVSFAFSTFIRCALCRLDPEWPPFFDFEH